MTARVVYQPTGAPVPVPLRELGRDGGGTWGLLDDRDWLAGSSSETLELLYLSPEEYRHATRRLAEKEIAEAVTLRRKIYSSALPSIALGVLEMRARDCIGALGTRPPDTALRLDLLSVTATFTLLTTLAGARSAHLFESLRAGEARIIAELESASHRQPEAIAAEERAVRGQFASEIAELAIKRGQPEEDPSLLPYYDVERTYLLTPSSPDLESAAHALHEPTERFENGLIMPVPERNIEAVCADKCEALVVFPTRHQFLGALEGMTAAQFRVEVIERMVDPGFGPYLRSLRLRQAVLRAGVGLSLGQDRAVAAVIEKQAQLEARLLPTWSNVPATEPTPNENLRLDAVRADGQFLVALCDRRGVLHLAGPLKPFTHALSQIAERA